jgi:hypothetical protein
MVRYGRVRTGRAELGAIRSGETWCEQAWHGEAGHGEVRPGLDTRRLVLRGGSIPPVVFGPQGLMARRDVVGPGWA